MASTVRSGFRVGCLSVLDPGITVLPIFTGMSTTISILITATAAHSRLAASIQIQPVFSTSKAIRRNFTAVVFVMAAATKADLTKSDIQPSAG